MTDFTNLNAVELWPSPQGPAGGTQQREQNYKYDDIINDLEAFQKNVNAQLLEPQKTLQTNLITQLKTKLSELGKASMLNMPIGMSYEERFVKEYDITNITKMKESYQSFLTIANSLEGEAVTIPSTSQQTFFRPFIADFGFYLKNTVNELSNTHANKQNIQLHNVSFTLSKQLEMMQKCLTVIDSNLVDQDSFKGATDILNKWQDSINSDISVDPIIQTDFDNLSNYIKKLCSQAKTLF